MVLYGCVPNTGNHVQDIVNFLSIWAMSKPQHVGSIINAGCVCPIDIFECAVCKHTQVQIRYDTCPQHTLREWGQ